MSEIFSNVWPAHEVNKNIHDKSLYALLADGRGVWTIYGSHSASCCRGHYSNDTKNKRYRDL
jgi:hypothetical protein